MNLIQQLEQEEIARLGKNIPEFAPGDTVIVNVNVVEGTRKRAQAYEGVVISRRNRGLNSNFIVRKISSGEGDALAGIIAGLAARGSALEQAAAWGVALHAAAGDQLALRYGTLGYLAREISAEVPALLRTLAPA
eukprot:gene30162-37328_t